MDVEVNILPCLIKYNGPTDFRKRFKDKIRKLSQDSSSSSSTLDSSTTSCTSDSSNSSDSTDSNSIPGGFDIKEICGSCTNNVNFSVKVTEKLIKDAYYPIRGVDKLLKDKYYVLFRGRQMRGSRLALEDFGYNMSVVTKDNRHKESNFSKTTSTESTYLIKTANISSITIWELENDLSPLSDNIAGYRYLLLSKPVSFNIFHNVQLSDYENEEKYFNSLGINFKQ